MMKASQAISREVELERFAPLMILIQNAGAQSGHLILENSGEWLLKLLVSLMGMVRMPATRVLQSIHSKSTTWNQLFNM